MKKMLFFQLLLLVLSMGISSSTQAQEQKNMKVSRSISQRIPKDSLTTNKYTSIDFYSSTDSISPLYIRIASRQPMLKIEVKIQKNVLAWVNVKTDFRYNTSSYQNGFNLKWGRYRIIITITKADKEQEKHEYTIMHNGSRGIDL